MMVYLNCLIQTRLSVRQLKVHNNIQINKIRNILLIQRYIHCCLPTCTKMADLNWTMLNPTGHKSKRLMMMTYPAVKKKMCLKSRMKLSLSNRWEIVCREKDLEGLIWKSNRKMFNFRSMFNPWMSKWRSNLYGKGRIPSWINCKWAALGFRCVNRWWERPSKETHCISKIIL